MTQWLSSDETRQTVLVVVALMTLAASLAFNVYQWQVGSRGRFADYNADAWKVVGELQQKLDVLTEASKTERSWIASQPPGPDGEWLERVIRLERSWAYSAGPIVTDARSRLEGYRTAAGVEQLPADPLFLRRVREASPARAWLPIVEFLLSVSETATKGITNFAGQVDTVHLTGKNLGGDGEDMELELNPEQIETLPAAVDGLTHVVEELKAAIASTDVLLGIAQG